MKFRSQVSVLLGAIFSVALFGCSTDAPTQGKPIAASQASADLDQQLDKAAALPPAQRTAALGRLQSIVEKGTPAQKARFQQLEQGDASPGH